MPPIKQHVHIVVKKPPPAQSTGPEVNVEDNGDTLTDLKTLIETSSFLPLINIKFSSNSVQIVRQLLRKLWAQMPRRCLRNPKNIESISKDCPSVIAVMMSSVPSAQ